MSETGDHNTQGPPSPRPGDAPHAPDTEVPAPQIPEPPMGSYAPAYPTPPPTADSIVPPGPPPPVQPRNAAQPQNTTTPSPQAAPTSPPPSASSSRSGRSFSALAAPIGAALVLVLGAAFLMIRGTGDATTADAPDDTVRVRDTDPERDDTAPDDTEPDTSIATTETTIVDDSIPPTGPRPTPPPLVEPPPATNETPADTTGATDVTTPKTTPPPPDPATTTLTTEGPPVDGPTVDDVRSALLLRADFSDPEWVADTPPPPDALCGENPDDENIVHREQVYFSRLTVEPTAFRQLSHTLYTYPDEATAARSFTTDVALLNDCAVDTVDVETTTYELAVNVDMFNAEDAATFPCSDDNALVVTQLNSAGADVPFLGEITAAFRCGIVVSVVSFGSTVSLDDLQDNDFFSAVAATNPRARELLDS